MPLSLPVVMATESTKNMELNLCQKRVLKKLTIIYNEKEEKTKTSKLLSLISEIWIDSLSVQLRRKRRRRMMMVLGVRL